MGPLGEKEFQAVLRSSSVQAKYAQAVDRESAHEMLQDKMTSSVDSGEGSAAARDSRKSKPNGQTASLAREILKSPLTRQIGREVVRGFFGLLKKYRK